MLVDDSFDHLQVTTVTRTGKRSVSSLIHCHCGYKQIMDTRKKLTAHALVYVSYPRENTPTIFSKNCIGTRRD